jgi:disulfide oxidoreductase YuzD
MKKLLYLVVLLAPLVLLASCIKEDYTDCERCTLTFSYTGDGTWDIFPEKITRVSLYVFNSDDDLVQTKSIEQNSWWSQAIYNYYKYDIDFVKEYLDAVNSVTADDVKALAKQILADGNLVKVVMRPEK